MDNFKSRRRPQPERKPSGAGDRRLGTPARPTVRPASEPASNRAPQRPATKVTTSQPGGTSKMHRVGAWVGKHRMPVAVAGLVLVLAVGSGAWWLSSGDGLSNGNSSEVARQYQERLPELKKKVSDNPEDAGARKSYAVALYITQDLNEARKQYEEAVRLNDQDASAFNNLGNVYRDLGDLDKAVESYRKAIKLNPKAINPYTNLANVQLYSKDQPAEAIKTYQQGLKEMPDNTQLEVLLAVAYEQSGDENKAKSTYRSILNRDKDNVAAKASLDRLEGNNGQG